MPAARLEFDKLVQANKTLETDPANKKANLLVGRFLCFVKEDWDTGLARLLLGADGPLRNAVDKDVAAASGGVNDRVEAGDLWRKFAATMDSVQKAAIEKRALHWYLLSVDELMGLPKLRVEKLIQEISPGDNKWYVLTSKLNDPKNWQTEGKWTMELGALHGAGTAERTFIPDLPPECVIQFRMTVHKGLRPTVYLSRTKGVVYRFGAWSGKLPMKLFDSDKSAIVDVQGKGHAAPAGREAEPEIRTERRHRHRLRQ